MQGEQPVTREKGEALATELGAAVYVECSSVEGTGVKEVLQTAVEAALKAGPQPKMTVEAQDAHTTFWRGREGNEEENIHLYVQMVQAYLRDHPPAHTTEKHRPNACLIQ